MATCYEQALDGPSACFAVAQGVELEAPGCPHGFANVGHLSGDDLEVHTGRDTFTDYGLLHCTAHTS